MEGSGKKPPTPHMDTWAASDKRSRTANSATAMSTDALVKDRKDSRAYYVHETPLNHFESSVQRGSFAPSELAAIYSGTKPSHDGGKVQSGAFYTRQVIASPGKGQVANKSTWEEGQVGSQKPIAVVFKPDMLSRGPVVARTIDGGNNHNDPVPQRTHPIKAAFTALKETEKGGQQLQRNAEVAVSGEIPMKDVAAVVVKSNAQLAHDLEASFARRVATSASFEEMGSAAYLAGRVINTSPSDTRSQTLSRIHKKENG